jgi:hypothetical protein
MQGLIKVRAGLPAPASVTQLSFSGTTARTALPTGSIRIRLGATEDCYYLLGDVTVVAAANTGVWLPAGIEEIAVGHHTYIAAIQVSAAGTLHIVRLD